MDTEPFISDMIIALQLCCLGLQLVTVVLLLCCLNVLGAAAHEPVHHQLQALVGVELQLAADLMKIKTRTSVTSCSPLQKSCSQGEMYWLSDCHNSSLHYSKLHQSYAVMSMRL